MNLASADEEEGDGYFENGNGTQEDEAMFYSPVKYPRTPGNNYTPTPARVPSTSRILFFKFQLIIIIFFDMQKETPTTPYVPTTLTKGSPKPKSTPSNNNINNTNNNTTYNNSKYADVKSAPVTPHARANLRSPAYAVRKGPASAPAKRNASHAFLPSSPVPFAMEPLGLPPFVSFSFQLSLFSL